jgi:hypothetical protein
MATTAPEDEDSDAPVQAPADAPRHGAGVAPWGKPASAGGRSDEPAWHELADKLHPVRR